MQSSLKVQWQGTLSFGSLTFENSRLPTGQVKQPKTGFAEHHLHTIPSILKVPCLLLGAQLADNVSGRSAELECCCQQQALFYADTKSMWMCRLSGLEFSHSRQASVSAQSSEMERNCLVWDWSAALQVSPSQMRWSHCANMSTPPSRMPMTLR